MAGAPPECWNAGACPPGSSTMSVATTQTLVQYQGNGSSSSPYPITYPFYDEGWIRVHVLAPNGDIQVLNLGDDFAVTGAGNPDGGELTTTAPWDSTHTLTIFRVVPLTQTLDLQYNDRLPAGLLEQTLDKFAFAFQQLAGNSNLGDRSIRFPFSEPTANNTLLPPASQRLDSVLYFNAVTGEMETLSRAEVFGNAEAAAIAAANAAQASANTAGNAANLAVQAATDAASYGAVGPLYLSEPPDASIPGYPAQAALAVNDTRIAASVIVEMPGAWSDPMPTTHSLVIGGETFSIVSSGPAGPREIVLSNSSSALQVATAKEDLVRLINDIANPGHGSELVRATLFGGWLVLTAIEKGEAGNSITVTGSSDIFEPQSGTLGGGVDGELETSYWVQATPAMGPVPEWQGLAGSKGDGVVKVPFREKLGMTREENMPRGQGIVLLDIPTHDGNGSTTHPSVLFFEKPWNGYHYWMAHTPFPNASREFPNICASNDGENWEVPAGLVNPIYTSAELSAHGGSYTADTELVYKDGRLYCFFIEVGGPVYLVHKYSEDGVTWSAPHYSAAGTEWGSPSIVVEPNGDFRMWNYSEAVKYVVRTSSDNGQTWGSPTDVILPTGAQIKPWHLAVRKVFGEYHMLHQNNSSSTLLKDSLHYLKSTDGIVFQGDISRPVPVKLGAGTNFSGQYRSTMVPVPGPSGLSWDLWVSQRYASISTPSTEGERWKISLHRDVILDRDMRPMTEREILNLIQRTSDFPMISAAWTATGTGGSLDTGLKQPIRIETGGTANNTCFARPIFTNGQYTSSPFLAHATNNILQDYTSPLVFSATFSPGPGWDANTVAWLLANTDTGNGGGVIPNPLNFATFGLKCIGYSVYLIRHNGTAETVTDTGITLFEWRVYHFSLELSGSHVRLYVNGVFHSAYDSAPNNTNLLYSNTPIIGITNGATAANRMMIVGKISIMRKN